MTPHEIFIQYLKITIALIGSAYFVWWSLVVLGILKHIS
jgi:hypothetical protein